MKRSAAVLAILTCILAGVVTGITGCAEQRAAETEMTASVLEAEEKCAMILPAHDKSGTPETMT